MTRSDKAEETSWYVKILLITLIILLSPFILLIVLILLIPWIKIRFITRPRLLQKVRKEWIPKNKFILFVYSDNKKWKEYAEKNIIPKISPNAKILNWSQRKKWIHTKSLETQIFKNFQWLRESIWKENIRMGGQEYNHMAIIFKPWNKPKIISFWKAFKEYEFGKNEKMKQQEKELYSYLLSR